MGTYGVKKFASHRHFTMARPDQPHSGAIKTSTIDLIGRSSKKLSVQEINAILKGESDHGKEG